MKYLADARALYSSEASFIIECKCGSFILTFFLSSLKLNLEHPCEFDL